MACATADETDWPDDAVEVGRITGAWGVQGGFRLQPHASQPQALLSSRRWYLEPPPGPGAGRVLPRLLRITQTRAQGDGIVARAQECADRDAAQALKGARVFVSRASFPPPAEGEYYWVDLIGMAVLNREGERLGVVHDLLSTGAHDVLRVRPDGAADETQERLIPFVDAYVDAVDAAARTIRVDWGLDY